jgi:hypothetical protein
MPTPAWGMTMTMDRRTREGIEACRPGSDDLQSQELADVARRVQEDPRAQDVYARVQKWDAAVSSAMEQVPVPEGLAERLLARLGASPSGAPLERAIAGAQIKASDADSAAGVQPGQRVRHGASWPRRKWLSAAAAVAATVVTAVYLAEYFSATSDTPLEELADAWLAGLEPKWHSMSRAPKQFAMPGAITVEAVGWQNVGQFAGVHGVAYKLVHSTAGTARLFVVKLSKPGLPATPPGNPQFATGGRSIGCWQSGEVVYLLVVDGNEHKYRAFVNPAQTPLAWHRPAHPLCLAGTRRFVPIVGKIV